MRSLLGTMAVVAVITAGTVPAHAAHQKVCSSADLRYPFTKGGAKTFGVFRLTVQGGSCATAHAAAKAFDRAIKANQRAGSAKVPRRAGGFTFKTLPAKAAQEYNERGTRRGVTVRFGYRVPNG